MKKLIFNGKFKNLNFLIFKLEDKFMPYLNSNWFCGYAEVPKYSKQHNQFDEYKFWWVECHGGITFSNEINNEHYIGFDTAHYDSTEKQNNLGFCIKECKNIIKQLIKNRYMERYNFENSKKIVWNKKVKIKSKRNK